MKKKWFLRFTLLCVSLLMGQYVMAQSGTITPCKDASGNSVPYLLATPCYINGNSQAVGSLGASKEGFVLWNYVNYGDGTAADPGKKTLSAGTVGSVWSVAYNPVQQKIYTSSFLKRFVSFGPSGIGAIYQIDPLASSLSASLLVDVNALAGVNVGSDPRVPSSGVVDDPNELPADVSKPSWDVEAFKKVGKIGMGGMAINPNGTKLYVVNLKDRNIIEINIGAGSATFSKIIAINDPGANGGEYRPWALKYHDGKLHVGIVASAETSQDDSKLMAYIVSIDPSTGTNTNVFSFPLTFKRGAAGGSNGNIGYYWHAWTDVHKNDATDASNFWIYPQPILSDIEFDTDGSMIVAFMDRAGHQGGLANYIPDASNTSTFVSVHNSGDIMRVCKSGGVFVLEDNGLCPGETRPNKNGDGTFNSGAGNTQGPGGGEFYWGDFFAYNPYSNGSNNTHQEISFGGLAMLPGATEIAMTAMDPTISANSGGVVKLSNINGARVKGASNEDGYRLYQTTSINDGTGGKASGLGDLVAFCPVAAVIACTPLSAPSIIMNTGTVAGGAAINLTASATGTDAATTYAWSGPSFTSTIQSPSTTAPTTAGTYNYTVTVSNGGACTATATSTLSVTVAVPCTPITNLSASVSPTTVITGGAINLSSTGTGLIAGTTYAWSGPGAFTATTQNPSTTAPATAGTQVYSVLVTNTNGTGVCTASATTSLTTTVALTPCTPITNLTASVSPTTVITGGAINLSSAGTGLIAGTTYAWSGPGAFTATTQNPSTTAPATAGSFVYSVVVTNANGTGVCTASATTSLTVSSGCVQPTNVTTTITPPTCAGATAQSNGMLKLSGFTNEKYQYSTGAIFNAGTATPASPTVIPSNSVLISNLTNTTQTFTVRIYSATDNTCFVDKTVSLTPVVCNCPPPTCASISITIQN